MRIQWVVISLVLGLVACSDDSPEGNNANNVNNVNNVNNINNANNANNTNNINNSNNVNNVSDMGSEDMAEDMALDLDIPDFAEQSCFFPDSDPSCPQGPYGGGTFLDTVEVVGDTSCCYDLNGDGVLDNKVGGILANASAFGAPVNQNIDAAIQAGALIYLFTYAGLSNVDFDLDFDLTILLGQDEDSDFTDNLAGTGNFLAAPESFTANKDPKWSCESARVTNRHLLATGCTMELFFPGLLDEVRIKLQDTIIEADVEPGPDFTAGGAVTLANGTLGGALPRDEFFQSLNTASNNCPCLQKDTFEFDTTIDRYDCLVGPEDAIACQFDASGCRFLASEQSCTFLALVSKDVDVDTDGDQVKDAFSIGVRFTGAGASITGDGN